jgi:serine/threonine-protein kinase
VFVGNVQGLLGRRLNAANSYARAKALLDVLTTQDPRNRQWQVGFSSLRLQQAALLIADGDRAAATSTLIETRIKLEALVTAEPSSRVFPAILATWWRLEARIRLFDKRADALDAATRALELGAPLVVDARADNKAVGDYAQSCLLAGRIAFAQAQPDVARRHLNRGLEVLASRIATSRDWRLLDPAAQSLVLLGKTNDARPLIEQLRSFGYHSIDPLAASILEVAPSPASSAK